MERLTSYSSLGTGERSMATSAFAPGRSLGIMVGQYRKSSTWALGIFSDERKPEDGSAVTARVSRAPVRSEDQVLHIGAAASWRQHREEAIEFFMGMMGADIPKIAVENPVGIMSTRFRKPDQYIQPYEFGDPERKKTGLWLKGLPCLVPTDIVEPNIIQYKNGKGTDSKWHMDTMKLPPLERMKARSITFQGIADAMADQWGKEE